jgi:hypothetical protein
MRFLRKTFVVVLGLTVAGCGVKTSNRVPVHPVSGKLLVGGKPAADAQVVLYPASAATKALVRPHATVGPDGSYRLTTYATHDGAPDGDFALTVGWPGVRVKGQGDDEPGPDRLEQTYSDPKKPASRVQIGDETAELATIDLKPVEAKPKKAVAPAANIEP